MKHIYNNKKQRNKMSTELLKERIGTKRTSEIADYVRSNLIIIGHAKEGAFSSIEHILKLQFDGYSLCKGETKDFVNECVDLDGSYIQGIDIAELELLQSSLSDIIKSLLEN